MENRKTSEKKNHIFLNHSRQNCFDSTFTSKVVSLSFTLVGGSFINFEIFAWWFKKPIKNKFCYICFFQTRGYHQIEVSDEVNDTSQPTFHHC